MGEMKVGGNIMKFRRKSGFTQDQLAEYMGVSKSSVSKWETGYSYPDILLLPQLATLFNISVDELLGYAPQLTEKAIQKLYFELAEEMTQDPEETFNKCETLIKKYYSCFPFLYKMAILYLNHAVLFSSQEEMTDRALELCKRVEKECEDAVLVKEAISLEAILYVVSNKPNEVLKLLGEEALPLPQDTELIGASFQLLGDMKRANEIFQVCAYQHLLFMIQDSANCMMMNTGQEEFCDETIRRLSGLMDLYHMEALHPATAIQVYLSAAVVYAMRKDTEKCLTMIEKYTGVVLEQDIGNALLHGDGYFTEVDGWLKEMEIAPNAPRGRKLIEDSVADAIEKNPVFEEIRKECRFRSCAERLKCKKGGEHYE